MPFKLYALAIGLGSKERIRIRNYTAQFSKDKIILYATHIVSDIETIVNHIIISSKEKLIQQETGSHPMKRER